MLGYKTNNLLSRKPAEVGWTIYIVTITPIPRWSAEVTLWHHILEQWTSAPLWIQLTSTPGGYIGKREIWSGRPLFNTIQMRSMLRHKDYILIRKPTETMDSKYCCSTSANSCDCNEHMEYAKYRVGTMVRSPRTVSPTAAQGPCRSRTHVLKGRLPGWREDGLDKAAFYSTVWGGGGE